MPKINVDLSKVSSGFELYPEDSYYVEILDTTKIRKSQAGEPKITWIAKIKEGEFEGKLISWDTSLQDQALFNLKALLEAIEVEWDEDGFDLDDCFGAELIINVTVGEWNEQPRNYVNSYHKVS